MKLHNIFSPLFALGLCTLISVQAFAANKVFWDGQAVATLPAAGTGCLRFAGEEEQGEAVIDEIGRYFDNKIKTIPMPFELVAKDDLRNDDLDDKTDNGLKFALVPLIFDDSVSEERYFVGTNTYYKTIVRTNISLMLCAFGGDLQDRLSFIYNIPMNGYAVLKTNEPATTEMLRKQFKSNAEQLINKRLSIPTNIEQFMTFQYGKTHTFIVDEVKVDPKVKSKLNQLQSEDLEKQVVLTLASAYTGAFAAAHPEYVVLPEKLDANSDVKWKKAIIEHINNTLSQNLSEDMDSSVNSIKLSVTNYDLYKVKASTSTRDATFFDKYCVKVGMEELTRHKKVENIKEYSIPNNMPHIVQINLPGAFASAARALAKK